MDGGQGVVDGIELTYCTRDLERCAERRGDAAWLRRRRRDPRSLVLPMRGLQVPVRRCGDAVRAGLLPLSRMGEVIPEDAVFLGCLEEAAVFCWPEAPEPPDEVEWVELRSVSALLSPADAGILAYARAMAHWHAGHRFCGACGSRTRICEAGHVRRCAACGRDQFPRTDPAVIVLVTAGEACLLGRSPRFPPGMYSTLAGFVEPGESLEQAVRREVREEAGISLRAVRYRKSQPWPFPQSLMIGFRAEAMHRRIRLEDRELEDARWFSRAGLRRPEKRRVRLPARDSIARFLIEEWLAEED